MRPPSLPAVPVFKRPFFVATLVLGMVAACPLMLLMLDKWLGGGMDSHPRDQLHALGLLSLLHLWILPGVPTALLLARKARPTPWMAVAGGSWICGAMLLFLGFIEGGLEAGWSFALASPLTRGLVAVPQVLALLFATLASEILALQVLVLHARPASADFQEAGPAVSARILALALAVQGASLFVALLERVWGSALVPPEFHPLLNAWVWTPIATSLLMMAACTAVASLAPQQKISTGLWPMVMGALSLSTLQLPLFPQLGGSFLPLCFSGLNALLAASAWALGFRLLSALLRETGQRSLKRIAAAICLAMLSLAPPALLAVNVLPASLPALLGPWLWLTLGVLVPPAAMSVMASLLASSPVPDSGPMNG